MFFLFGRKSKAKAVEDGEVHVRRCPMCDATTKFYEVSVEKTYTAWVAVKLWESESTAFACSACREVMQLDATLEPELSERERARLEKQQAKLEAKRAKEKAKEEAAQRKRIAARAEAARKEKAAREEALDDELAAMKARLGID